ncbi:MAG: hypothetical protein ABH827_01190 [bacterium]
MKELRAMFGFLLAITVGYLYIYDGNSIHASRAGAQISLPATGSRVALGNLFNLINANNPNKSSNFLIWYNGRWQGAQTIGCDAQYYKDNGNFMVKLISDTTLVNSLIQNKQIKATDKTKALRVWLYFELNIGGKTHRFYLNDPNPGKYKKIGRKTIYPAKNIMNKYK